MNLIQARRCPCPSVSMHANSPQSEYPHFGLLLTVDGRAAVIKNNYYHHAFSGIAEKQNLSNC